MKRVSAPGYDLFKSIVTFILVAILVLMLLGGCATKTIPSDPPSAPTETIVAPNATETLAPSPVPSTVEPTATPTTIASTPTSAAAETPTATPGGFATPGQAESTSCNTSVPSLLNVGQTARVLARLNMRNDPSIDATLIQTNATNTQVEIIGGPVCTPVGDRAYLWWQIRLANGAEGWSAESPLNAASYFLEPIP